MRLSPIALFVYNRPWHVRQVIDVLRKNDLAADSELIIFSDGLKDEETRVKVEEVRQYLKTITGFKKIQIHEQKENQGLANSIINGITKVVNEYGRVIVLEDDLVTSPYFLRYMNEALSLYEQDSRVISIHGYVLPVKSRLPETFFIKGADCWGWSTWKRGWDLFENNGSLLFEELKNRNLTKAFDFNGTHPFTEMLKSQIAGKNNSWAIRWCASAFLNNKLTLYPGRSLVCNIGNDETGTNWGADHSYNVALTQTAIDVKEIEVSENGCARKTFEEFFKGQKGSFCSRLKQKMRRILCR